MRHKRKAVHPIKAARMEKGWSQTYLAELLGKHRSTVAKWEADLMNPNGRDTYELIYELLGVTWAEIMMIKTY